MRPASALGLKVLSATGIGALAIFGAGGALAGASPGGGDGPDSGQHAQPFQVSQILAGASLQHTFTPTGSTTPKTETLSNPDDITRLRDTLFVGFQNGVVPKANPAPMATSTVPSSN
jgi:hypothetical protein